VSLNENEIFQNVINHYVPRSKRELIQKKLNDPDRCIEYCTSNETALISNASSTNTLRLISIGFGEAKKLAGKSEVEMKKHIEDLSISKMGPYFDELCQISKKTEACYKRCPQSQLRDVTIADYNGPALYCEPINTGNWPTFTEYYKATQCNNQTILTKPCDSKCGKEQSLSSATRLELNDKVIKYDTDAEKNTKAAAAACKSMMCHVDCYEPILTQRCGDKAMDAYRRLSKLEPGSALAILQILNVIDADIIECTEYYKPKK